MTGALAHRTTRLGSVIAVLTAATLTVAACSSSGGGSNASSSSPASSTASSSIAAAATTQYPVTITTCGQKVTFDAAPTRAVTNDINTFEDMVALGLEPHMAGDFGLDGYGPNGTTDVPASLETAFTQVKQISPNYITLEPLVGAHPDFLFAGWNYGLSVGTTLTPDNLAKYGIKTLVLAESCAHVQKLSAVSIQDTYSDLTNLGIIFNVQAKAAAVIAGMKAKIAAVQAKVAGITPKKTVFLYDSGTDAPFTAPGLAEPDALISLAGGVNVFHDLKQSWTSVSWEQVVKDNADCIIINDYGTPTYAQKVQFLKTSSITKNLTAVKNGCFIHLTYGALTPSPENADAVQTIAQVLYPDKF